jgi:hypothetical protein
VNFHVVQQAENLVSARGAVQDCPRALAKTRIQYGMRRMRVSFAAVLNTVVLCGGAVPEPCDLREYEPHLTGLLLALLKFGKRVRIDRRLRVDETLDRKDLP